MPAAGVGFELSQTNQRPDITRWYRVQSANRALTHNTNSRRGGLPRVPNQKSQSVVELRPPNHVCSFAPFAPLAIFHLLSSFPPLLPMHVIAVEPGARLLCSAPEFSKPPYTRAKRNFTCPLPQTMQAPFAPVEYSQTRFMKTSLFLCFWGLIFTLLCLPQASFGGPPDITSQPTNQRLPWAARRFFGDANGSRPLNHQWRFNGTNLVGGQVVPYTHQRATDRRGRLFGHRDQSLRFGTSSNAVLTVLMPPGISIRPASQRQVSVGGSATFSVTASGALPLGYFWRRNGTPIAGANSPNYTTNNVQLADSGSQFSTWSATLVQSSVPMRC